jgi:hypothetical protein
MDLKEWKHPKQWSRCEKKIAVNFGLEEAITWFPLHRYSKKKTGSNNNKHVCKLKHAWVELKNEENNCYW